jgi:uncharacterized membrane protein YkvA (DUF1232 family)
MTVQIPGAHELIDTPATAKLTAATNAKPDQLGLKLSWRQKTTRIQREVHTFYFAFKHPRSPWYAKVVAGCSAGYLFSPIQLIPSYIPVIGFMDDFAVLFIGAKILQRIIPQEVFTECRQLAELAEMRRREEITSVPAIFALIVIAAVWLLGAVGTGILVAKYMAH